MTYLEYSFQFLQEILWGILKSFQYSFGHSLEKSRGHPFNSSWQKSFETSSEDILDNSWEHNQDTEVAQVIEDVAVANSAQRGSKRRRGLLGSKSDGPLDLDWW